MKQPTAFGESNLKTVALINTMADFLQNAFRHENGCAVASFATHNKNGKHFDGRFLNTTFNRLHGLSWAVGGFVESKNSLTAA